MPDRDGRLVDLADTRRKDDRRVVLGASAVFQMAFVLVSLLVAVLDLIDLIDEGAWGDGTGPTVWLLSGMAVVAAVVTVVVTYRMARDGHEAHPEAFPGGEPRRRRLCLLSVTGVALTAGPAVVFVWLVDVLGIPPEVIEELAK